MEFSTEKLLKYGLWELVRYFFYLGYAGFGGPVALVGFMHRDLVQKNQWISEEEYKEGLALAQLAPGPLAAQLAIYWCDCWCGGNFGQKSAMGDRTHRKILANNFQL